MASGQVRIKDQKASDLVYGAKINAAHKVHVETRRPVGVKRACQQEEDRCSLAGVVQYTYTIL